MTNTPKGLEALTTRDASLRWVEQRLALMLPREPASELAGRAEVFVAIAERYDAPIELLIAWIDTKAPGKQWAAAEWRRWCERRREAELLARHAQRERS